MKGQEKMVIAPISKDTNGVPSADVMASLKEYFSDASLTFIDWTQATPDPRVLYDIKIETASEPAIILKCLTPGNGFGIDAWDEQSARVAVAIRAVWHTDDRIIAVGDGGGWYVDLVPGMTPEDVISGRRPFSELRE